MKAFYEIPEMEIVAFDAEDIITTSFDPNPGPNTDDTWGDIK